MGTTLEGHTLTTVPVLSQSSEVPTTLEAATFTTVPVTSQTSEVPTTLEAEILTAVPVPSPPSTTTTMSTTTTQATTTTTRYSFKATPYFISKLPVAHTVVNIPPTHYDPVRVSKHNLFLQLVTIFL